MTHNPPSEGQQLDENYAQYSVINRRNFLSAAGLAASGSALLGASNAEAAAVTAVGPPGGARGGMAVVSDKDREYMREAIRLMRQVGVVDKTGGPFGAVIVLNGKIIAASGNSVVKDKDPTAHAEVNAIRMACRNIGSANLAGAVLYTSCECCPMCYATAYWARIDKIFFAAGWRDYEDIFDDSNIGLDLAKPYPQRQLAPQQILQEEGQAVWQEFRKLPDGARY